MLAAGALLVTVSGCGGTGHEMWEVTAENKADVPCSIFISLDDVNTDNSTASVSNLTKGNAHSLIVGDGKTVVRTVKVSRGKDEQVLNPDAEVPAGKRYAIVVGADGKVETTVTGK
jgi:hypothetical protein